MISGQRLAAAREARGLTQDQLAVKVGKTRGAVGQWETGKTHPDPATLDQLADILECSLDWLYGRVDEPLERVNRILDADAESDRLGGAAFAPLDWAQLKRVRVEARVQAGLFAAAHELPPEEKSFAYIPVDLPYADLPLAGFLVYGDSMNEFYPHGTRLIVVPAVHLGQGWMPKEGQHVIVQRLNDWSETELTVKEIRYGPGPEPVYLELWPRSTNKSFDKPWRFEIQRDPELAEDKLQIVGLVVHFVGSAPGV